ncbi:glutathione S-transferase C-terminal domain-containing protein [Pseudoteredinibacter isoporae]|uniref:Glutathione S-transferase n=1 Tax=Pseudoteredinibacter isoporae TaxID=570281 RepID=A0A7X0JWM2_9GAMM|nr:glutathione S-transferase C-terminal domain-containing protein [Pseudoteredinibacter isoporae]MBB6523573.1 glutathione S-transferase [Pseudoteredinibacter isoporae]NHO89081.1 glutathione S-transferase family protein [Pseudoteredinibacter isoporae]NIB22308.1 glutathione S-transferase family protein [Pseudoteredinibacter isoporae]
MIKLYGFGPSFGMPDPSSFVLKVNCYMRMAGIDFETVNGQEYLRKAPKGKLPYIEWDGRVIPDSQEIFNAFDEKYDRPLEKDLNPEQQAQSYLMIKSLDENLYWCLVHSRWIREDGWEVTNKALFSSLPGPLKLFVPALVRRGVAKNLKHHGMGLHSDDEILAIAKQSIDALAVLLGDKPYFFGDKPSNLDATVFALIVQLTHSENDIAISPFAKAHQNLVDYCERIAKAYYPEEFNLQG